MNRTLKSLLVAAAVMLGVTSCGTGSLGQQTSALGGILNGSTVGDVLISVLGVDHVKASQLVGRWTYLQPGCAFTSKDLLSKAGGEVAANQIKQKLASHYATLGINTVNTEVMFTENGRFTMTFAGRKFGGTYTYDEANDKIAMKATFLTLNCYTKRNSKGISLLFEASKLLQIVQMATALSGNTSLQTVGELSKNYDGLRIGFDMKRDNTLPEYD